MPAPGEFSEALLLRSVDYGDADRVVTLLTSRFGKASYLARNARRSKRRFGGALSPFLLLEVEVGAGRGQLGTLLSARVTRAFPRMLSDLARMAAGYAALELLRELWAEHEPVPEAFVTAVELLDALERAEAEPEPLLVCFQARAAALAGFAPGLSACGLCGKIPGAQQSGLFDARLGHLVCRACGGHGERLSATGRAHLQHAAAGGFVQAAQRVWSPRDRSEARAALRAFIEHRIGKRLSATSMLTGER